MTTTEAAQQLARTGERDLASQALPDHLCLINSGGTQPGPDPEASPDP
ncbi:hypothetical protein [Kitasatospora sp. NPDC093102]